MEPMSNVTIPREKGPHRWFPGGHAWWGDGYHIFIKKKKITKMAFSFIDVVITNIPRTVWRKPT